MQHGERASKGGDLDRPGRMARPSSVVTVNRGKGAPFFANSRLLSGAMRARQLFGGIIQPSCVRKPTLGHRQRAPTAAHRMHRRQPSEESRRNGRTLRVRSERRAEALGESRDLNAGLGRCHVDRRRGQALAAPGCGPDEVLVLNRCLRKCPDGTSPNTQGKCPKSCPAGQQLSPKGDCQPIPTCGPNEVLVLNRCLRKCPDGSSPNTQGKCPKGELR